MGTAVRAPLGCSRTNSNSSAKNQHLRSIARAAMLSMVLEKTITQIILTFLKSYVKDVEVAESSFWSGDVSFNNLELRLDVLQESTNLPIYFTRGFVRTLKIHIPWTNLAQEPTVVSVDTVEVIFTTNKAHAPDTSGNRTPVSPSAAEAAEAEPTEPQEEGWVETTIQKMITNLALTITNVSIKLIEPSTEMSLFWKSFQLVTTDSRWRRPHPGFFVDSPSVQEPLFKIFDFTDVTLCLDYNNEGTVDNFQRPVLPRVSLSVRSSWADFPNFPLQVDVHCDVLQVHLSNCQWVMLLDLVADFEAAVEDSLAIEFGLVALEELDALDEPDAEIPTKHGILRKAAPPQLIIGVAIHSCEVVLTTVAVTESGGLHRRRKLSIQSLCSLQVSGFVCSWMAAYPKLASTSLEATLVPVAFRNCINDLLVFQIPRGTHSGGASIEHSPCLFAEIFNSSSSGSNKPPPLPQLGSDSEPACAAKLHWSTASEELHVTIHPSLLMFDENLMLVEVLKFFKTDAAQLTVQGLWSPQLGKPIRPQPELPPLTPWLFKGTDDSKLTLRIKVGALLLVLPNMEAPSNQMEQELSRLREDRTAVAMIELEAFSFEGSASRWPLSNARAVLPGCCFGLKSPLTASGLSFHFERRNEPREGSRSFDISRRREETISQLEAHLEHQEHEVRRLHQLLEEASAAAAELSMVSDGRGRTAHSNTTSMHNTDASRMDIESGIVHRRKQTPEERASQNTRQKWKFRRVGDLSKFDQLWLQLRGWILVYFILLHLCLPLVGYHYLLVGQGTGEHHNDISPI